MTRGKSILNQIRNVASGVVREKPTPAVASSATLQAASSPAAPNVAHHVENTPKAFDVRNHIPMGVAIKNNEVHAHRGKGCYVWDKEGKEYLDMTSGIGVLGTGHSHPHVVEAVKKQVEIGVHFQQSMFESHEMQNQYIEHFLKYTPGSETSPNEAKHDIVFFTSCGSVATENAVKVAKMHTKRPNVIAINNGFHGRTMASMGWSSSKISYKGGFNSGQAGVFFCHESSIEAFESLLDKQTGPTETAAVILEPVQGEGGVYQIPKDFMQHLRKRCTELGIVLIFDEVQAGSGRCGSFWGHDLVGVTPDIVAFAKAIASGFPLGGITFPNKFLANLTPNALGNTYAGNAVCLAAAKATLEVFEEENLIENSRVMGKKIAENMRGMPYIDEVRQHGLLIGADIDPSWCKVGRIIRKAADDHQMIIHSCGANALRVIPPYVIGDKEVEIFSDRLYKVLKEVEVEGADGGKTATTM